MREAYIWIAFCVFALLVGMRIRKRITGARALPATPVNKNQRPKLAREGGERQPRKNHRNRPRTERLFMIGMLILVFLLIIGMIPALLRDIQRVAYVDTTNLLLRLVVFCLAVLVLVSGYLKLVRKPEQGREKPRKKRS